MAPQSPRQMSYQKLDAYTLPGANAQAYLMIPFRLVVVLILFAIIYPIALIISLLRAIYIRVVIGRPSQALKYGTRGNEHKAATHYPCAQFYKEPLDEPKLRKAFVELCGEDGIKEEEALLEFMSEEPAMKDWPLPDQGTGSYNIDDVLQSFKDKGTDYSYYDWIEEKQGNGKKILMWVFNGKPGKPTYMIFAGSMNGWDGSSNFNFIKELMNRYMGNPPNAVFQKPELSSEAAAKVDQEWFLWFLLKMPLNLARNFFGLFWNIVRAFKWAGGNGVGSKITAMNFSKEDSDRLYAGAKALGATPFACMTYAAVKASREVLKQQPYSIVQQASLQTRHFPIKNQTTRDLVGDWLFGPVQRVPSNYTLEDAVSGYKELSEELRDIGPKTLSAWMAKAYGIVNSGAAFFEVLPTYNDDAYCMCNNLFMNNYGIRTMPPGAPFHVWNWNAPLWLGLNTINVDGRTSTLIGSMFWGIDVVKAVRDNIEATLRDIMAKAPADSVVTVPKYGGVKK